MSEWQPIETAPKDGTRIDLWMIDESGKQWREADAYWVTNASYESYRYTGPSDVYDHRCWSRLALSRDGWFAPNHDYDNADGFCDVQEYYNPHPNQKRNIFTRPTHWMPLPAPPPQRMEG